MIAISVKWTRKLTSREYIFPQKQKYSVCKYSFETTEKGDKDTLKDYSRSHIASVCKTSLGANLKKMHLTAINGTKVWNLIWMKLDMALRTKYPHHKMRSRKHSYC